jgi:zinc/manganese transport system substrate-binding protein
MRHNPRISVLSISVLLSVLLIVTLFTLPVITAQAQGKKLNVITSTTILLDFAQNVAGDKATLSSIVSTDGDAHAYEPVPDDIKRIAGADLILVNGLGLDGFIENLVQSSGTKAKVITVTEGIGIRRFDSKLDSGGIVGYMGSYDCGQAAPDAGDCDPHMWQDPTNVIQYTLNIRNALIAADPDNAAAYKANAAAYVSKLQKLDAEIWQGLSPIATANRVLVTNHDALGYFADRYGFKIVGVVLPGGSSAAEPKPQDLAELTRQVKAQGVKAIFTENIGNEKLAQQIASQTGVKVVQALYTDALGGSGTPGETYLGMMRANLKTLEDALGGAK